MTPRRALIERARAAVMAARSLLVGMSGSWEADLCDLVDRLCAELEKDREADDTPEG